MYDPKVFRKALTLNLSCPGKNFSKAEADINDEKTGGFFSAMYFLGL